MNLQTRSEAKLSNGSTTLVNGAHEVSFRKEEAGADNELPIQVTFRVLNGISHTVRGFLTASGEVKARCYVTEQGRWSWEAKNQEGRCIGMGDFQALASNLPGKLALHENDNRQFRYSNGKWYLHFGDTSYLYLDRDESRWKAYIDQAAQAGFTKIRTSLCDSSGSTAALFDPNRKGLDLESWDEFDNRILYALERYPHIQLQLIPFGSDWSEYQKYGDGDPLSHLAIRYAQERFSALPNVHWCMANHTGVENGPGESTSAMDEIIKRMGADMREGDQFGSLITLMQDRFSDFRFADERWCNIVSISHIGQVTGEAVLKHRALANKPVTLDEDRSECEDPPQFPRYYFRRLFWGTLLSGGHPTYIGLKTDKAYDDHRSGIQGYYDACNNGRLRKGAHDFLHIRKFFLDTGIILVRWIPDDAMSGNNPLLVKSMRSPDNNECIAYVANPDAHNGHSPNRLEGLHTDKISGASETFTTFTLELPFSNGTVKWFSPASGEWKGQTETTKNSTTLLTPAPEDWVVWVKRK